MFLPECQPVVGVGGEGHQRQVEQGIDGKPLRPVVGAVHQLNEAGGDNEPVDPDQDVGHGPEPVGVELVEGPVADPEGPGGGPEHLGAPVEHLPSGRRTTPSKEKGLMARRRVCFGPNLAGWCHRCKSAKYTLM